MLAVTHENSERLRVVLLSHVARLSGAEIGLMRFVQAAHEIDATVIVAEDGPLVDALRDVGARVEVLPLAAVAREARRADIGPGRAQALAAAHVAAYVPRLAARLRALRPHVVHAISLKSGVYASLAARLARRPMLWHLHDHLSPEYLRPSLAVVMRQLVTRLPDALAAPSRSCLASVGPGARRLPTAIVPFPVPIPGAAAMIRPEVRCVGIVGRITPWKGQDVFLRGFARAFPEDDVRARVVGSALFGEEEYGEEIHRLAADLGIADRVDFVGFRTDIGAELQQLDLLVHASVLPDPLSTVVLEGMAAGVPTISANAGGHAEHVAEAGAGLLFAPGDAGALAQALRRAADDRELRVGLGERGREKARDFTPEALVGVFLAFYDDMLAARGVAI
jgi:glycosyltransferase involved in cell wall biosynthesis